MRCPQCHTPLREIPTAQSPQIDVCPRGHGLWLDAGELALFVEDDLPVAAALALAASSPSTAPCPHCARLMEQQVVTEVPLSGCQGCRGYWLEAGQLTQLHGMHRGRVSIRFHESDWYARARARHDAAQARRGEVPPRTPVSAFAIWIALFGMGTMLMALHVGVHVWRTVVAAPLLRITPHVFVMLAAGLVGGVGLFVYGFTLNGRKNMIESTPTSLVRSLAVGLAEVAGTVAPFGEPLLAPFSRQPCVVFFYRVEERHGAGKNARWRTIAQGQSDSAFWLDDGTAKVLVVPSGADLLLKTRRIHQNTAWTPLSPTIETALTAIGIATRTWRGRRTLRCHEGFIVPAQTVYIMGMAQEQGSGIGGADNPARLYIGEHPDHDFMISDRSESELLTSLRWRVAALVWGGPALVLACAWGLLALSTVMP